MAAPVSDATYDQVYQCMNALVIGQVYRIDSMPQEVRDLLTMFKIPVYLDILYYMVTTDPTYVFNIGYHTVSGLPLVNTILIPLLNHVINDRYRLASVVRVILHCNAYGRFTDGSIIDYHNQTYKYLITCLKLWIEDVNRKDLYKHFTELPSTKRRSDGKVRWIRQVKLGPMIVAKCKAKTRIPV